jgi:hypothetical protein
MNAGKSLISRRSMLLASSAAAVGWFFLPFTKTASAQKATVIAKQVDRAPVDPDDSLWQKADSLEVPMAPQAVVKPRTYETGVGIVKARALYDNERLAFLLEWDDAGQDVSIGGVGSFRDAVAVQFPSDSTKGIPYFGMGELNNPVTIYHWKADWQFARDYDTNDEFPNMAVDWYPFTGRVPGEIAEATDYGKEEANRVFHTSWWAGSTLADPDLQAKTPVEKLTAEGFGTITSVNVENQDGKGKGVRKDSGWKTVISIPRAQERFSFERGDTLPLAFAAWDGSSQERGGEKAISTWYFLSLEKAVGPFAYINPLLVVAGVAIVQVLGLRLLRRKAKQNDQTDR